MQQQKKEIDIDKEMLLETRLREELLEKNDEEIRDLVSKLKVKLLKKNEEVIALK